MERLYIGNKVRAPAQITLRLPACLQNADVLSGDRYVISPVGITLFYHGQIWLYTNHLIDIQPEYIHLVRLVIQTFKLLGTKKLQTSQVVRLRQSSWE